MLNPVPTLKRRFLGGPVAAALAFSWVLAAALSSPREARAFGLDLLGGLNRSQPSVSSPGLTDLTTKAGSTATYGAFLDFRLDRAFSLETGVQVLPRTYVTDVPSLLTGYTSTIRYLEVPLLLRFNALPLLSFAAGGYFAQGIGDTELVGRVGGTQIAVIQSIESASIRKQDYGLLGSVRIELPLAPAIRLLVDGRYLYGLRNVDTSGGSLKWRDLQLMGGLGFGI